jgi:hypothetical protein
MGALLDASHAVFNEGVEASARRLEETAQDYMQMRSQILDDRHSLRISPASKMKAKAFYEKAQLLQGQATHIRSLKKP